MPLFAVPGLVWHAGYLVAARGNELSDPGIEPAPPALKGKVLTTGQQVFSVEKIVLEVVFTTENNSLTWENIRRN